MSSWSSRLGLTREAFLVSSRATVAAVLSLLLSRSLKLPEFYWAPISTIVILLSTLNPLTLAWQRFAGTAIGSLLGALIAYGPRQNWIVYGVGLFIRGILSSMLRIGAAYRFAAIALTIVVLVAHDGTPWTVALHRFIEVSVGIAVALVVTALWRLPKSGTVKT